MFYSNSGFDACNKDQIARGWSASSEFINRYGRATGWFLYCPCSSNCTTFAPVTKYQLNTAVLEYIAGTSPGSYGSVDIALWDVTGVKDLGKGYAESHN